MSNHPGQEQILETIPCNPAGPPQKQKQEQAGIPGTSSTTASTERIQIPFGSGNFGLLILKWRPVLPGCGQGVHLARFHLWEDRGLEGSLWEREKFSSLPPSTSQKRGRSLVDRRQFRWLMGYQFRRRGTAPGMASEGTRVLGRESLGLVGSLCGQSSIPT